MLLDEIIDLLSAGSGNLTDALLKTKVLLHQIGRKELVGWVNNEINGYPDEGEIPGYRHLPAQVLANVANIAVRFPRHPLPLAHLTSKQRAMFDTNEMRSSLAILEEMMTDTKDDKAISRNIPLEANGLLGKSLAQGFAIERAWCETPMHEIRGILIQVRSRLLDFLLELKDSVGVVGTDAEFTTSAKSVDATALFRNAVFGANATIVITGGGNAQVTQNIVAQGDFAALARQLNDIGISEEQVKSLRSAIDEDSAADGKPSLDGKTGKWLGTTMTAIAKGGLKVATDVAASVITKAMNSYLGLPP